ncbi:MAG TPA: tetratricopeptide repeat protein, partial [Thermoanaerobaculia bacterium]|nr:tetratricopeptide repeat protein [Thermoanaerobaculia bacterium]
QWDDPFLFERQLTEDGLAGDRIVLAFLVGEAEKGWLAENVPQEGSPRDRLSRLLKELTVESGLAIDYRRGFTGTAGEVFRERKANCLGFMNLFVGLAREMGISAYFLAIEDKPIYDRAAGDLVLIAEHVAAGFGEGKDMLLLDFYEGPERTYDSVRRLSDVQALARYYSNRGVEVLQEGKARQAVPWLETAVKLDPQLASAWVNLGVAERRTGDLVAAEAAYDKALELDARSVSAYQNFAALLKLKGEEARAQGLLAISERLGSDNPFAYLNLGDWSLEARHFDDARRYYRRALTLATGKAEALAALGDVDYAQGRLSQARRWLKRALKADPTDSRTRRLAERLQPKAGS